jgi:DNA-binding beta-propeller fold protein YncE
LRRQIPIEAQPKDSMTLRQACTLATFCLFTAACAGNGTSPDGFEIVAQLDIGLNPHQISFSEDGRTAYVATAGEDRITVIDAVRHESVGTIPVPGTPLGVIPIPNGKDLAVARFVAGGVARYARSGSPLGGDRTTSAGASLFVGPYPGDRYLVSIEQADSVHVFDAAAFTFVASYPTGDRPFPAAATSDGRLAFVPGYADGTVTVIDLFNDRVRWDKPQWWRRPPGRYRLRGRRSWRGSSGVFKYRLSPACGRTDRGNR